MVRIGFGAGDLAQNLVYPAVGMYLLFFYTDVFGIAPAAAATMFLVVQLADILWSLVVGVLIDSHSPPWGKYRSYLLLAGIPMALFAALCFWTPIGGEGGAWRTFCAFASYAGFSMLFTVTNVAYGALGASISRDVDELTAITSVRIFMANAGCFAASAGVPLLVSAFAGEGKLPWRTAFFMGLGVLPSFIFMPLVPVLRRRLGRKGIFFAFAAVAAAGMLALYALSRVGRVEDRIGWAYAAQFVKATGIVVATSCMWALVPEVVTYSEHRTGRRVSGIVNAVMGVFFRIGMGLGRAASGLVLAWTGYRAVSAGEGADLPADAGAWLRAMAVFAAAASMLLVFSFLHAKERIAMEAEAMAHVGFGDLWRELRCNAPMRVLALFFTVAFAMMSVGSAAGAYFMNGLDAQPPLAQEGIRWLVCVVPAFLLAVAAAAIARYPLDDAAVARLNREIAAGR